MFMVKCIPGPSSSASLSLRCLSHSLSPRPRTKLEFTSGFSSYRRTFSTSCTNYDHYKTLGVPQCATKAQIKSHFYQRLMIMLLFLLSCYTRFFHLDIYSGMCGTLWQLLRRHQHLQLSKKHHPDVSDDVRSKDIFTRVTEAYKVLSDDRERRIYDRSLLARGGPTHPAHPRAQYQQGPGASAPNYAYRPRPGATHAWERTGRRPNTPPNTSSYSHAGEFSRRPGDWSRTSQHTHPDSQARKHPGQGAHYDPSLHVYGYAGRTPRQRANEEDRALQGVQRVSGLRRALQLVGLLILSAGVVGRWK
ncbi:hypothetical protein D9615_003111 [Tricholomella constricta]|uniref:J domain-containing protein n=1 Tax=Tricholomella constricta TaxID=117010 RepID=A0A8H5M8D5_9AGAR|nr:hypothetical protein D9615_003111 [Tricholomella constricta]